MTMQRPFSSQQEGPQPSDRSDESACPHRLMVPRWDRVEDMGDESKAVGYKCDACGTELTLEEATLAKERLGAISL